MAPMKPEPRPDTKERNDRPCWRETLFVAFSGQFTVDHLLERYLDHLERTS